MGGLNIQGILNARSDVVSDLRFMVLQPQSDIEVVRQLVGEKGFQITREMAVLEDGKYYFAMLCENVSYSGVRKLSRTQAIFGPYLISQHDKVLYSYLDKEKRITEKIIDSLKYAEKNDRNLDRLQEAEDYLSIINEVLQKF